MTDDIRELALRLIHKSKFPRFGATWWQQSDQLFVREELIELVRLAIAEGRRTEREQCAIAAWAAGIDAHNKAQGLPCDAREVGSKAANAIRALANTQTTGEG